MKSASIWKSISSACGLFFQCPDAGGIIPVSYTHLKYAYHPKGELGNNYPVIIGGGYKMDSATVMILEKKNDELRIKVLNVRGEVLLDITV